MEIIGVDTKSQNQLQNKTNIHSMHKPFKREAIFRITSQQERSHPTTGDYGRNLSR